MFSREGSAAFTDNVLYEKNIKMQIIIVIAKIFLSKLVNLTAILPSPFSNYS